MIDRPIYLDKLKSLKDKDIIKVITGIRRCGKSTLFELYIDHLKSLGIKDSHIIRINLDDMSNSDLLDGEKLHTHILSIAKKSSDKYYIFLDEIQNVTNFQKTVDSLFLRKNLDIYITGSNAYLLSGELATYLTGRYIEIKMLPLSFQEFSTVNTASDKYDNYTAYATFGGLPYITQLDDDVSKLEYLDGVYNSVMVKDVLSRNKLSNTTIFTDVAKFIFDNIGSFCSGRKIANTLTSAGRKVTVPTVESYVGSLIDSFALYKVERYDLKGKKYLSGSSKYYVADMGLRRYLIGDKNVDMGHVLENIVFLELKRRGYEVYAGKSGNLEVDFVAKKLDGSIEYYQVALTTAEEATLARELKSLDGINDHSPKFLLTLDVTPPTVHSGIRQINALDWLLDK